MQRTLCHCNRLVITILSQGSPSGRLPRYARNDKKCVARYSIKSEAKKLYRLRTKYYVIARSNATWQSPGRDTSLKKPRKILLYLRGEKGANKHKSEHCRPRQCDFKSVVCAVGKLRIYHNFGVSRNITLTKSKYNLRSKFNRPSATTEALCRSGRTCTFPLFSTYTVFTLEA